MGPPIYLSWIFQYSSLKYRVWRIWFFPSFNPTGYFFSSNWFFFQVSMARVEYFDGPCLTIYSLQTWILLARNPVQTWKKNPAGYFKLENWKNYVQIDRESECMASVEFLTDLSIAGFKLPFVFWAFDLRQQSSTSFLFLKWLHKGPSINYVVSVGGGGGQPQRGFNTKSLIHKKDGLEKA